MIDRQYIPLFVFATCLALGLALAFFTSEWPTALAIALSGCALALAMRPPQIENHDTAFLEEDLAELRASTESHAGDIAILRSSIDEVADIVESLATDMQRLSGASDTGQMERLQAVVGAMGERMAALDAPHEQTVQRIEALEQTLATLKASEIRGDETVEMRSAPPVALAATGTAAGGAVRASLAAAPDAGSTGSITERAGRLRERFSRVRKPRRVSALPIFDQARNPHSLLIDDPEEAPSVEGTIATLRHAIGLIGASENPQSRIFVRIPAEIAADSAFADALEPVLEAGGDAVGRLIALVPQMTIKGGPPRSLALLLNAGARFALERMSDWSADLEALASRGLVVIVVDGPAMAKSAVAQKGDPTRLRQVLHAQGIELLAADIETRLQLDAVNSLLPDLIAGPGLGEVAVMDASV